ncbi:cadherin-99C-like [Biomphalaria glabrata]|uniref:Cadherin-99C-like n=1 Tax=Biomphalaria glabrata TaxID=6526 RepID=A0A9W2ZJK4_BIOGL|nr:cadherin-99C-like [Biomphalaria glabrata]
MLEFSDIKSTHLYVTSLYLLSAEPPGYESYFITTSALYRSNTKQYRCDIEKSGGRIVYRSNTSSIELIIEAQEQSPNARTEYASVLVSVLPSNLNPPVITYNSNTGYIFENSSVGARVYTDAAASTTLLKLAFTDPETSSSDLPVQFTTTVSAGQPFAVTQEGYIVLNSSVLDYEATTKYVLTVTVTKATSPWYSATVTVTVNVLNVNDNSPVILVPDNYSVTVTAGNYTTTAPRVIVTVQATDIDFGPPQFKLNRVVPANATSKFSVSQNGSLSVTGSLSPGDVFAVYVTASDLGKPVRSTEAFVVVSVPISCRKSPRKYLVYINEEETINATVYVPIEGQPLPLP